MTYPTGARRPRRWKAALGLALATTALLVSATSAGAAVFTPTTGAALQTAVSSANSTAGADTIKLCNCNYLPSARMTITDSLTITGDPQFQGPGQGPQIDGTAVVPLQSDLFTVNAGVKAVFKALTITGSGDVGFASIRSFGTTELDNLAVFGNNATELVVDGGTTTANNANISDGTSNGITNNATLILNNSTVSNNSNGGIVNNATMQLNNTIVANNNPLGFGTKDCTGVATSTIASWDSDSTCGVAMHGNPGLVATTTNGGPTPSSALAAGSPAINAGNNSICPTTDQRFFVRTDAACDIGAYEAGSARDTTAPTCVVTATRLAGANPTAGDQQDVTVRDSGSGIGLQTGQGASGSLDAITGLAIDNGSVAFTPFTAPSRGNLVLTATRATSGTRSHWSFTATDWAGNAKACS